MKLDAVSAQLLLLKCTGDEIWSIETCEAAGVPQIWIEELVDCFESGYDTDRNTIYVADELASERMVNQYQGVLDLHLAYKLSEFLGMDWKSLTANKLGRRAEVQALQEALDEL